MSPQQPSDPTCPPSGALPYARPAGALRQLVRRSLVPIKAIWTILATRRPVRVAVGSILLLIGIAGLFLPVIQGVATIIAALAILRQDIPLAERVWQRWVVPCEQRCRRWFRTFRQRRAGRSKDSG